MKTFSIGISLIACSFSAIAAPISVAEHEAYLFDKYQITKEALNAIQEPLSSNPRYMRLTPTESSITGYYSLASGNPVVGYNMAAFIGSNHPLVGAAHKRADAEDKLVNALGNSRILPSVHVEGLARYSSEQTGLSTPFGSIDTGEQFQTSAAVVVSQKIVDFKLDLHDIPAQEKKALSERLAAERTQQERAHLAVDVFLRTLVTQAKIKATASLIDSLNTRLKDVESKAKYGRVLAADVLKVKLAQSQARQQLVQNRESHRVLLRALQLTLGLEHLVEPSMDINVWRQLVVPNLTDRELAEQSIEKRPDLARMREQMRALKHQAESIAGEFYPTVNAQVSANVSDGDVTQPDHNLRAGVAVRWDIFASGTRSKRARAIVDQLQAIKKTYRFASGEVAFQLESALADIQRAKVLAELAEDGIRSAEENLRVENKRQRSGRANITDVLDAQTALRDQVSLRDEAHINFIRAWAKLQLARGEPFSIPVN